MYDLEKNLKSLEEDLATSWQKLELDKKIKEKNRLEAEVSEPEIWNNPALAKEKHESLSKLSSEIEPWLLLKTQISDISELIELGGEDLAEEIKTQVSAMETSLKTLKKSLRFTGEYDKNNAILRITAGVGGTEAMDWAGMLERMYLRFFERNGFKATLLERTLGEEAGIKTAVYEISGQNPYGTLKSEHGVHRLVRLSPLTLIICAKLPFPSSKFSQL